MTRVRYVFGVLGRFVHILHLRQLGSELCAASDAVISCESGRAQPAWQQTSRDHSLLRNVYVERFDAMEAVIEFEISTIWSAGVGSR